MRARTWQWTCVACLLAAVVACTPSSAATRIIYCDARATGADDGTTWENAFKCLQDALVSAGTPTDKVEIRVAQGIYKPHEMSEATRLSLGAGADITDRYHSFILKDNVVLLGGYAGLGEPNPDIRNPDGSQSILSGDLAGNDVTYEALRQENRRAGSNVSPPFAIDWEGVLDYIAHPSRAENSLMVVTASVVDETAILDGFTVTGGHADRWGATGAGMLCTAASPVLVSCRFLNNTAYSTRTEPARGAGMAVYDGGRPTLRDCTFEFNIAFGDNNMSCGGGMYSQGGYPRLINCQFARNVVAGSEGAYQGGALYNSEGSIALTGCQFSENLAFYDKGGAIFNLHGFMYLTDCTLRYNAADDGGAIYNTAGSELIVGNCLFVKNRAVNFGRGGAVCNESGELTAFSRCRFVGNVAESDGGALYHLAGVSWSAGSDGFTMTNCAFSGNSARRGGAVYRLGQGDFQFVNCTLAANEAYTGGALYSEAGPTMLTNCILWLNQPDQIHAAHWETHLNFCDVQGGSDDEGNNLDADPRFADVAGPDKMTGTEDDNLRLTADSPCIDAGDSTVVSPAMATDLVGERRIVGRDIDLGAYEFPGPLDYYVDAAGGSDSNSGRHRTGAFATIQRAIDSAADGYRVLVLPGVYREEIDFKGKAITVAGESGAPILEAPAAYAVSFYSAEGPDSMLQNLIIRNSEVGIFISGSSPLIRNVTVVDNKFGIAAYAGAGPTIDSCILWKNTDGDLFGCAARFSCIEHEAQGEGNISKDPLFADAANGDFHLLSEYGRFVPAYGLWAFDDRTSPCIDAGDPATDASGERMPNGGRINMGAFGGTAEASLSECPCIVDVNPGGLVNSEDLPVTWSE